MEDSDSATVAQLPDDMIKFTVQHVAALESGARLASLTVQNRPSIQTPHYLVPTSRGVIPHLSPDTLQRHTNISAVYIGLEDCKSSPNFQRHTAGPLTLIGSQLMNSY